MHAAAAAQQDDRFPVNFDMPPTPLRADGAVLLPQPWRSDDETKKEVSFSPFTERQASSVPAPPAEARAQHSLATAHATEQFEELPFCYEAFKQQMRTYPCLQEIKHQVRAFVTRYMHKVAPDGELVAEVVQFISQISAKFAASEVWKDKPAELDRAIEGLEHFVCLNLYNVLFSPQLSEDSDKDKLLFDRVMLLRFIEGKHLDLPPDCCRPDAIDAAAAALAQLDKLKTPREKLASIATAGTILRDMLRHPTIDREQLFLSALVLATLRAQPKHLFSNLQFVRRFRNPMKMTPDEQYYLMHLNGAVEYLEKVQPQWLSIEPEEFVASVNKSVDSLGSDSPSSSRRTLTRSPTASPTVSSASSVNAGSNTLTVASTKSGAESASQITPTANALPPWRTASSAASGSTTITSSSSTSSSTITVKASISRSSTKNATATVSASAGSGATRSAADFATSTMTNTNTHTNTSSLAVSLNSDWCDIGTELFLVHSAPHCDVPRSLASLVPAPAPAPSACSGSSGIVSDLADLDPLGQASCTADWDSLSLHSLAWGAASPADPSPRSRTASMRSALSHQSTDVAQCHAADLAAFGPAAVSSSHVSSSQTHTHTTTSSTATSSPGRPSRVAPPPPLDPYRDGGIQQLLAAAAEPPVDKFLQCDIEALNMSDIPLLLADYKRMAALNASLSRILRLTAP